MVIRGKEEMSDGNKGESSMNYVQKLGEDLGVCSRDCCKCQVIVLVNIDGGSIYDYHIVSDMPAYLRTLDEIWFKKYLVNKQDGLYIDWSDTEQFEKVKTVEINGQILIPEECQSTYDSVSMLNYHNKEEIKVMEDGWYELLVEIGCWSSYCHDYGCYEGDGDVAFKVLKSNVDPNDYDVEIEED